MQQASDFLAESEALFAVVSDLGPEGFSLRTQFKGWTIDDVFIHLHFWNEMVDLSLQDVDRFDILAAEMAPILMNGGFRAYENARVDLRGPALRAAWIAKVREMAPRWQEVDPKRRMPWVGPSMSARSSMTARQMETWAHGQEVFDRLGQRRVEADRIKNIVILGVNTFAWSHQVHGLDVPADMPFLSLRSPSGQDWTFGKTGPSRIVGPAADFAAVVTQTRAFADTDLIATGDVAIRWMEHAQCFAGSPQKPPAAGSRHRQ